MTVYSVIPDDIVFAGIDDYSPHYMDIEVGGCTMQIESISPTEAKVVRLLSTNPQDYLNPAYMPGTIISLNPIFLSHRN
ncbi:hypothetical protein D3C73_831260 [compost metagenome]